MIGAGASWPTMRVLVTGRAGFVGSHIVDLLVESGHEAGSLDRLHSRVHASRPKLAHWRRAPAAWRR